MSGALRIIIIIFTFICLVTLVIFSTELVLLNRDREPNVMGHTPGNEDLNDEELEYPPEYDEPEGTDSEQNDDEHIEEEQIIVHAGERTTFTMPGNLTMILYVQTEYFEVVEDGARSLIYLRESEDVFLEVLMIVIPHGAQVFAEDFLAMDFGAEDAVTEGSQFIANSSVMGIFTMAVDEDSGFEAWIHEIYETDDLGIAFTIAYQDETQRNMLIELLDSLQLLPAD